MIHRERRGRRILDTYTVILLPRLTYDALIASTAVSAGLPLYTVNPDDFAGIADLDLRPMAHADRAVDS